MTHPVREQSPGETRQDIVERAKNKAGPMDGKEESCGQCSIGRKQERRWRKAAVQTRQFQILKENKPIKGSISQRRG